MRRTTGIDNIGGDIFWRDFRWNGDLGYDMLYLIGESRKRAAIQTEAIPEEQKTP